MSYLGSARGPCAGADGAPPLALAGRGWELLPVGVLAMRGGQFLCPSPTFTALVRIRLIRCRPSALFPFLCERRPVSGPPIGVSLPLSLSWWFSIVIGLSERNGSFLEAWPC